METTPDRPNSQVKLSLWNAQSARNKALDIADFIAEYELDILVLTETWLRQQGDEAIITEMMPPSYSFQHVPRQGKAREVRWDCDYTTISIEH